MPMPARQPRTPDVVCDESSGPAPGIFAQVPAESLNRVLEGLRRLS